MASTNAAGVGEQPAGAGGPSEEERHAICNFLSANGLAHLIVHLAGKGETIASCVGRLYDEAGRETRPAFLAWLAKSGVAALKDRQALAKALGRASREGEPGICESAEAQWARTAWLDGDGDGQALEGAEPAWEPSGRRFLVFTSAGDANSVAAWTRGRGGAERDWELCVSYYGAQPDPDCLGLADRGLCRAGGKFPNLLALARRQPAYLRSFEAVLVADDDLGIDGAAISALFALRRAHDLWVLQPANHATQGKADIPETRAQPGVAYRLVNFVEVTAPLFRTEQLLQFLREYVPRRHESAEPLVGYGIDCWFCQWLLRIDASDGGCAHPDRVAVADSIPFVNPTNEQKPRGREIDHLQAWDARAEAWRAVAKRRGLAEAFPKRTFERVALN